MQKTTAVYIFLIEKVKVYRKLVHGDYLNIIDKMCIRFVLHFIIIIHITLIIQVSRPRTVSASKLNGQKKQKN